MLFNSRRAPVQRRASVEETLAERRVISSGGYIGPDTAAQSVAVYSAANFIASTCSQLPLDVFRGEGRSKREVAKTRFLADPSGEGYGLADWLWNLLYRSLIQGNAVGRIVDRDAYGFPAIIQLQPLDRVLARHDDDGRIEWRIGGKKVPREDVFHFRAFPQEGSVWGLSPVGLHMRTVRMGMQAEEFGSRWFEDGAHPSAILTSDAKLDPKQAATVKARFLAAVRGSREPVVLPSDIKYQPIQINPLESQFLETQKYSAAECARIFGPGVPEMLGYSTGDPLTYTNVEQRSLHVLIFTLNNWLGRVEDALSSERITPRGQYVRFNRSALLQSTTLDRYQAYAVALKNRFQTVNEVRELEDWQPVEWGDEPNPTQGAATGAEDAPKVNESVT